MNTPVIDIDAPIENVTVLEDRACVRRRARITLSKGSTQLRVPTIATVASDKTLAARIVGDAAAQVTDVRVRRGPLDDGNDSQIANLQAEHAAVVADKEVVRLHREDLERIARSTHEQIARQAARGTADIDKWRQAVDAIRDSDAPLRSRLADLETRAESLRQSIEQARAGRASDGRVVTADALIRINAAADCEVELTIEYVVAGVAWRPIHSAEILDGADPQLRLRTGACIWQATTENWTNVALCVSTERGAAHHAPPEVVPRAVRARVPSVRRRRPLDSSMHASVVPDELPGVDDRQGNLRFTPSGVHTLLADGRPRVVPLFEFVGSADVALNISEGRRPCAFTTSRHLNESAEPLLAGPVDLIRAGGVQGRSEIGYVAPGEAFDLVWGPDRDLRVRREAAGAHISNIGASDERVIVESGKPAIEVPPFGHQTIEG